MKKIDVHLLVMVTVPVWTYTMEHRKVSANENGWQTSLICIIMGEISLTDVMARSVNGVIYVVSKFL